MSYALPSLGNNQTMGVQDRDWYWQDRQGGPHGSQPFSPPRRAPSSHHPAAIVLAALIGAGVMSVAVHAYLEWRARVAIAEVMRAGNEAMQRAQQQIEQQQREDTARQQARRTELDRQEASRTQAIRKRQEIEEAATRGAIAEADRKERAWAKFYRQPPSCNDAASMECANGFIRAKRAFEEKYARGAL